MLSATFAVAAMSSLLLPGRLWLVALTFSILAIGAGLAGYRGMRRSSQRLVSALSSFVGAAVLTIALTKVGLTLAAVHRLASMLSS